MYPKASFTHFAHTYWMLKKPPQSTSTLSRNLFLGTFHQPTKIHYMCESYTLYNHLLHSYREDFFVAPLPLPIQSSNNFRIHPPSRKPPPTSRHTKLRSTALSMDAMANSKPLGPTVVKRLLKNSANHRGGAGRSCRCPKAKSNSGTSTEGRSCSRGKDGPGNKLEAWKGDLPLAQKVGLHLLKFNSQNRPLKSNLAPKVKRKGIRLPTIIFRGQAVKLSGEYHFETPNLFS